MSEPIFTERAEADLDEIFGYLAARSPDAARRLISAILEASRLHGRFPGIGQMRDEIRPGLRCFVVLPYVVYYRSVGTSIEVLRRLHGARDVSGPDVPEG